jgi:hypothetical protein
MEPLDSHLRGNDELLDSVFDFVILAEAGIER